MTGGERGEGADRRQIRRISVHDDLRDAKLFMVRGVERLPFEGSIENISLGGMFVSTRTDMRSGGRIMAEVRLPEADRRLGLEGMVVHEIERDDYLSIRGFGVAFQGLRPRTEKALRKYILTQLTRDEQRRQVERATERAQGAVPVEDRAEQLTILSRAANDRVKLTVLPLDSNSQITTTIKGIDAHDLVFDVNPQALAGLVEDRPVRVVFNVRFDSYYFQSHVARVGRDGVRVILPDILWGNDKRAAPRSLPDATDEVIEIGLPHPPGERLARPIIERADGGLSFLVEPGDPYFLPGTPLGEIRVLQGNRVLLTEEATVRHVSATEPDSPVSPLRVGVELGATRRALVGVRDQAFGQAVSKTVPARLERGLRRARFAVSSLVRRFVPARKGAEQPRAVEVVRFRNSLEQELVGIVNRTFTERQRVPVVVIPTAFSRRKESTSALALTLVDNFRRNYQDVAVLRFDYTNTVGESFIDPGNREPGREYLHFTTSGTVRDLLAALDFATGNPLFEATEIVLVSFSLNSLTARRLLAEHAPKNVTYWIAPMGVADAQDSVKNCSGDIDFVGETMRGVEHGAANILGSIVNMGRYCRDLVEIGAATLPDAKRDMARITIPVTWVAGEYDGWVNPERVRDMLGAGDPGNRNLIQVPTGHMPTSSEEAFAYFRLLTRLTFEHLFRQHIEVRDPSLGEVLRVQELEWSRTPRQVLEDPGAYWGKYLTGGDEGEGFDILLYTDAYRELMERQAELLDLRPGQRLLDLGCGTGNFVEVLLRRGRLVPSGEAPLQLQLVDFSHDGLALAREKLTDRATAQGADIRFLELDLNLSPARVVHRWLAGEIFSFGQLAGRIPGLTSEVVETLSRGYSSRLHGVLRGDPVDADTGTWLRRSYQDEELAVIRDLNRAARWFRGKTEPSDLTDPADAGDPPFSALRFERLDFYPNPDAMTLPFPEASADRVLSSLVLSYLDRPRELLLDAFRVLRPGGIIVISSMRPDTESSLIYRRLVDRIQKMPESELPRGLTREELLRSARTYSNSASSLVKLAEEGTFHFYGENELRALLEEAGYRDVRTSASFGDPPQAWIATARRP